MPCPAHIRADDVGMQDLRDLFRVTAAELESSETQRTLHQLHSQQRKASASLNAHLQFLRTLPRYAGQVAPHFTHLFVM